MSLVTVSPTGQRLATIEPITVTFGHDHEGNRMMTFGGDVARGSRQVVVNGVPMSVWYSVAEISGAWQRSRHGYVSAWRADVDGMERASEAARRKLERWFDVEAPRIAEKHGDMFGAATLANASTEHQAWLRAQDRALSDAALAADYAELHEVIAAGWAVVSKSPRFVDDWAGKLVRPVAPSSCPVFGRWPVVAVAVMDGETVGVALSVDRKRMEWVPVAHAEVAS